MSRAAGKSRLERDLALGGACSATGLYISYLAARQVYHTTRWLADVVVPASQPPHAPVQRRFMAYPDMPAPLIARDDDGSAMLLAPCGIFYVAAPGFRVLELRNGAAAPPAGKTQAWWPPALWGTTPPPPPPPTQPPPLAKAPEGAVDTQADAIKWVSLPPHAYHLFRSAETWGMTQAQIALSRELLRARAAQWADECLLQMFLSDLRELLRLNATTPRVREVAAFLLKRIFEYTRPATWGDWGARMLHVASAPSRPTASSLWRDLEHSFPHFFRDDWMELSGAQLQHLSKPPFFYRAASTGMAFLQNVGLKEPTVTPKLLQLDLEAAPPEDPRAAGAPYDVGPAWPIGGLVYTRLRPAKS